MMKTKIRVTCLDTDEALYFVAWSPMDAMQQLIYYLNLSHKDPTAAVQMLGGGRTLSVVHNGKTWSCPNWR